MSTASETTTNRATAADAFLDAPVVIEPAHRDDARAIARVLQQNAAVRTLILQPQWSIERHIHELLVVRGPHGAVQGCAQLRWHRPRLVEISSVAIAPSQQGLGLGQALVRACVEQAMRRDPLLLWAATESPEWFQRLGFEPMPMSSVPLPVLLERLGSVFRQPWQRWLGTLLGRPTFMRWNGRW
jgi:amino-acid N-acetyltransferase